MNPPTLGSPLICWNQPDPEYRKAEGLSQSAMKEVLRSPAHYMARYGPEAEPFIPTTSMLMGTAVHARVLEPETFDAQFCSRDQYRGEPTVAELQEHLTAEGIEFKKSAKKPELLALAYPDGVPQDPRTAFNIDDWRSVMGMADALRTHDLAGMWFCPSQQDYRKHNEVSVYSKAQTGQILKARLDRLQFGSGSRLQILDLKTSDSASPHEFKRKVSSLSYDLQAAWYTRLAQEAFPGFEVEFLFVVVERSRPHGIRVFRASESLIANGQRKMDRALEKFSQCSAINLWDGYDPEITDLELPSWAMMEEQEQCLEF